MTSDVTTTVTATVAVIEILSSPSSLFVKTMVRVRLDTLRDRHAAATRHAAAFLKLAAI
jgi:hypothetical protein